MSSPMVPASSSASTPGPSWSATQPTQASRLKARPVPPSTLNSSMFDNTSSSPTQPSQSTFTPMQPSQHQQARSSFAPLQPTQSTSSFQPMQSTPGPATQTQISGMGQSNGPNYNISLTPSAPSPRPQQSSMSFMPPAQHRPPPTVAPILPTQAQSRPPPGYTSGLMQPTVAAKPTIPTVNGKQDWGDFDPLK